MIDATYHFCPRCATPLVEEPRDGRLRPVCPACRFVHFLDPKVVTVVLIEHEGRVLLGRRAIEPARGEWSFIGGYVDRGEAVDAAAIREAREETGLQVELTGLLGVYSAPGAAHIVIAYRARPVGPVTLAAQAAEIQALRFVGPEATPALAFPFDGAIWRSWQAAVGATPGG